MDEPLSLLTQCGRFFQVNPRCGHIYCVSCFPRIDRVACRYCEAHQTGHCKCLTSEEVRTSLAELKIRLDFEDADFVERQIEAILNGSTCSKCSQPSEMSLICVTCIEELKLKRLKDEKWIIQELKGNVKISDALICSECAATSHGEHELVDVAVIQNLSDAIKNALFLECYHHQKSISFFSKLKQLKKRMEYFYKQFDDFDRNIFEYFKTCSEQLISVLREEKKKLTDLMLKIMKLVLRMKKMQIEFMEKHIHHQEVLYESATTDEEKNEIKRLLISLNVLKMKFESSIEKYPGVRLTPGDIEEIDMEITARMETLEQNYKNDLMVEIELEEGSKFYKYQAVLKEIEDIDNLRTESNPSGPTDNDYITKCDEQIRKIEQNFHFDEPRTFYYMEIIEAQIRIDKNNVKMLENNERLFFVELMKLKFFPKIPGGDPMDAIYNQFFEV